MASAIKQRCPKCHRPLKRSNEANARYWLLIHAIAEKLRPKFKGKPVQYSPEVWHIYFKQHFLGADDVRLPNGCIIPQPRSSAELNTQEFRDYMEKVELWAGEREVWLDHMEGA